MEQILDLFLGNVSPFSLFLPALLELDREFAKSELFALYHLYRRNQTTMSQLAADLGAPLSTVTGIVTRLERKRLIERQRDPDDRRTILVELSPEGRQIAIRMQEALAATFGRIQTALTSEELTQLMGLVQKVITAMQNKPPLIAGQPTDSEKTKKIMIDS